MGLDASWFLQMVGSIVLIPMVVLSLRAYKLISYAVIVDDDFIPAF